MQSRQLEEGDVVQINPDFHFGDKQGFFGACLAIVREPREWGALVFVAIPGKRGEVPGSAFYRAKFEEIEYVGKATWFLK